MTAADRQARSRARRAAAGCSRVSVTLSPEAAKALDGLRGSGTVAAAIERALLLDGKLRELVEAWRFGSTGMLEADHALESCAADVLDLLADEPEPLAVADPFGAEFVAGIVPDPSKAPPSTATLAVSDPWLGLTPAGPVRCREEFAGMPDPLEALRGMPSPVDPRKPR